MGFLKFMTDLFKGFEKMMPALQNIAIAIVFLILLVGAIIGTVSDPNSTIPMTNNSVNQLSTVEADIVGDGGSNKGFVGYITTAVTTPFTYIGLIVLIIVIAALRKNSSSKGGNNVG